MAAITMLLLGVESVPYNLSEALIPNFNPTTPTNLVILAGLALGGTVTRQVAAGSARLLGNG
ncbi:hypothetical protein [Paeniglutamicibacter gangotriensis]|uniref:hypothetical protein n=1 Tax=Paeniglutamicibacter gangotriensis TaxID=254787 RepID=UPI001268E841|nr:hypothetical protein [Paeniglutamicibacter gangotriensis]